MPRLMCLIPLLLCARNTIRAADDDAPYQALLYPVEARVLDYVSRSGESFVVSTRMATPDSFETVKAFYTEKLGRELEPGSNRIRVGGRDPHPLVSVVANDSLGITPGGPVLNFDADKPRGISLVTFVKITAEEQITLVISRLDGEEYTHIVLTHAKFPRGGADGDDVSVRDMESTDLAGEMHRAAATGNVSHVESLLDAGASVNDKDVEGRTPLMVAAANGHAALCQTLMLLGGSAAERDKQGRTALMHAAENGHAGVIDALFQMQTSGASQIRELNVDRSILEDADVESRESFHFPIATNAQDNDGETAQMKAAVNGDMNCLRALHRGGIGTLQGSGIPVDATLRDDQGRTALMHAVINGHVNLIRDLAAPLERHLSSMPPANLNFLDLWGEPAALVQPDLLTLESLRLRDHAGQTAVQLAEERDDPEMAEILHGYLDLLISNATAVIELGGPNRKYAWWGRGRAYEALGETERAAADFALAREAAGE